MPRQDDGEPFSSLYSDGPDAAMLAEAYGLALDEWQRNVLSAWLARRPDDTFACLSCGLAVPRQNGKNAILEARELYGMVACGEKVLHTAHRVDTARKSFLRLAKFFETPANAELAEMVVSIRKTNGQESITLSNGGMVEFSSRVNGGGRGSTYDLVVFDEAQELTDDQMESIMSTLSASPNKNRQLVYTGTPPSPVSPGTVFRRKRDDSIEGRAARGCWHEWSVEEVGDVTDRERWYRTNPAMGIRLDEDFTREECETLTAEGFARERLGWWSDKQGGNAVFSKAEWDACAVAFDEAPAPSEDEVVAFGVKFTPDGGRVALSAAAKGSGHPVLVECLDYRVAVSGVNWLVQWLLERRQRCAVCVIDGKSGAAALAQKLLSEGFPKRAVVLANSNDVCAAASMLKDAVAEREVVHVSPTDLDKSALSAQRRAIGANGGWGFGSGDFDSALIESASLAYRGVMTTKRRPGRKSRLL